MVLNISSVTDHGIGCIVLCLSCFVFIKSMETKLPEILTHLANGKKTCFIILQVMKYREICIKYNQYLKKVIFSHVKI